MSMNDDGLRLLVASQERKLWLLGGMLAIAGLGFLFTDGIGRAFDVPAVVVQLCASLLTFSTLAGAFFAVRCTHCGLRLVMYAMSHKGVGEWLQWLLTVKKCPKCGATDPRP